VLLFVICLFSFESINYQAMKEDKLKKMIKTMFLLREVLKQKQDDDRAFRFKPKTKVLTEVDEIIDRSLEDFYALRMS
jgi:hypothetical protein